MDEDLRDCENNYDLDYELRMVTNMTTELQTQLGLAADLQIAAALKAYLGDVFTDYAHDVDLSFYDVVEDVALGDSVRLHHESHIMNANQSSYTLYIPVRQYMHLAVANIDNNGTVSIEGDELCHGARLVQVARDTVENHRTGLFTARLPMHIQEGEDQTFDVSLYMANCASSLILDTLGSHIKDIRVYASGFATEFSLCDSVYRFSHPSVVRSERIALDQPGSLCFTTVSFPSRDVRPDTKVVIETEEPFVSESADEAIWQYEVYTRMPDGKTTKSLLGISQPLRAGQLKIIKVRVLDDGAVQPLDSQVSVNVALDWSRGMDFPVEF